MQTNVYSTPKININTPWFSCSPTAARLILTDSGKWRRAETPNTGAHLSRNNENNINNNQLAQHNNAARRMDMLTIINFQTLCRTAKCSKIHLCSGLFTFCSASQNKFPRQRECAPELLVSFNCVRSTLAVVVVVAIARCNRRYHGCSVCYRHRPLLLLLSC